MRDPALLPALPSKATVVQEADRSARADFLLRRGKAALEANPSPQAHGALEVAESAVGPMTTQLATEVATAAAKMATLSRPEPGGTFAYRLATPVPEHWLPLLPQRTRPDELSIGLRLGALPRTLADETTEPIRPLGRILQPPGGGDLVLREEEVRARAPA